MIGYMCINDKLQMHRCINDRLQVYLGQATGTLMTGYTGALMIGYKYINERIQVH